MMNEEYYKEIQERINKGEIVVVDLGIINGMHRYKFIEIRERSERERKI